jgi:hypothetical protein
VTCAVVRFSFSQFTDSRVLDTVYPRFVGKCSLERLKVAREYLEKKMTE